MRTIEYVDKSLIEISSWSLRRSSESIEISFLSQSQEYDYLVFQLIFIFDEESSGNEDMKSDRLEEMKCRLILSRKQQHWFDRLRSIEGRHILTMNDVIFLNVSFIIHPLSKFHCNQLDFNIVFSRIREFDWTNHTSVGWIITLPIPVVKQEESFSQWVHLRSLKILIFLRLFSNIFVAYPIPIVSLKLTQSLLIQQSFALVL